MPIVLLIALGTALWWGLAYKSALRTTTALLPFVPAGHFPASPLEAAVIHFAGVLIIACPCAMGLATPAAIMAGVNAAARRGILIRDGIALEKSGQLTAVIFDKTGTLTDGKLSVTDFNPVSRNANQTQSLARALTEHSNHPISQAVRDHCEGAASIALENWRELRGHGLEAAVDQSPVRLGSLNWLHESNVQIPANQETAIQHAQGNGATVIGLARDRELLALIHLRDQLKPAAPRVVDPLVRHDLKPIMISGDQVATARAIGRSAGFAEADIHGEIKPEDKARLTADLQREGHHVAFVGDGINDAPALEQADLGIAVARASDVARESADIILLRSDIAAIPHAIDLAQATLRTIRQNLFWAFFYNAAAIPLAVLGIVSPVVCAAAMGLSDLVVIGNALRLLRR